MLCVQCRRNKFSDSESSHLEKARALRKYYSRYATRKRDHSISDVVIEIVNERCELTKHQA